MLPAPAGSTSQAKKHIECHPLVRVEGGGRSVVSRAGPVLLVETIRKSGLDGAISAALAPWRKWPTPLDLLGNASPTLDDWTVRDIRFCMSCIGRPERVQSLSGVPDRRSVGHQSHGEDKESDPDDLLGAESRSPDAQRGESRVGPPHRVAPYSPAVRNGVVSSRDVDGDDIDRIRKIYSHGQVMLSASRPVRNRQAPLDAETKEDGIFRTQLGDSARRTAWQKYWAQVDGFTPAKEITVPIRISQARGDERVLPAKTEKLLGQLRRIPGQGTITEVFYDAGDVATPDPESLGEHFGLLVAADETEALVGRIRRQLIGRWLCGGLPLSGHPEAG